MTCKLATVREGSRGPREEDNREEPCINVFARLLAACQTFTVINKCEDKELGKFADQINALCNKWIVRATDNDEWILTQIFSSG